MSSIPYAEVIYEPGSKSVVNYETEDELKAALQEQHNRAKSGDVGGPGGGPAERVTKVFTYGVHPADYNGEGVVHVNELSELVNGMTRDGVVDVEQLREALRDELSPVYPVDQGRHESMYKMEGTPFDLSFLEGGTNDAA